MTINPDGRWDRQQDEGVTPQAGSGLRPFGAEPQDASQAKPLVPNAAAICEQFIGQVLVRRNVVEEVAPTGTWHRLSFTPVVVVEPIDGCAPDEFMWDIDSAGDGWVRITKPNSEPLTVHYCAGMAETMGSVPVPLTEGIKRLERHLAETPDEEPPAVVTALWRPYRRLRLK